MWSSDCTVVWGEWPPIQPAVDLCARVPSKQSSSFTRTVCDVPRVCCL